MQSSLMADLIVMGTHGRRGAPRFFLGSVAERVVREAGCPVLTTRMSTAPQSSTILKAFNRILCPIDFEENSLKSVGPGKPDSCPNWCGVVSAACVSGGNDSARRAGH